MEATPAKKALAQILDGMDGGDALADHLAAERPANAVVERDTLCVECEDQAAAVRCRDCADYFCQVCCFAVHRKGTRRQHRLVRWTSAAAPLEELAAEDVLGGAHASPPVDVTLDPTLPEPRGPEPGEPATPPAATSDPDDELAPDELLAAVAGSLTPGADAALVERAKYVPLRLELTERKYLRLLEAALAVSEYTDHVDIVSYVHKPKRIVAQIRELCSVLSGLLLAADYKAGQQLFQDRSFEDNHGFFQDIFELGRRYKIMNPERMRATYGKLVYLLQDSAQSQVQDMLGFSCVRPLKTVHALLEKHGALGVLADPLAAAATMEIVPDGKRRSEIQREIRLKERAIEHLAQKYGAGGASGGRLSAERIRQCLYSIGDNHAYVRANRDPCLRMAALLKQYFTPSRADAGFSLGIQSGSEGARLTHSHQKQFQFVLQSLTLWALILDDMFRLWTLAEQDLLDAVNEYRLRDTGQGLNRVQGCPRVSRAMHTILAHAQAQLGGWVGSSVVHLGDSNVPNALLFIDKYTQVSRILSPVVQCVDRLDLLVRDNRELAAYIDAAFGSVEQCRREILCDFFRHAFDGSGADNFFDAGSCIDGRLTSAWNWCAQIEKKRYYPVFLLCGFFGFDGKFE